MGDSDFPKAEVIPVDPTEEGGGRAVTIPRAPRQRPQHLAEELWKPLTDLSDPAAQQLILREVRRLEREVRTLKDFERNYYRTAQELAVLQERVKKSKILEVVGMATSSVGGVLVGASLKFFDTLWYVGAFSLALGIVLFVIGIVSRSRSA